MGVIYAGRGEGMNPYKAQFARKDDGARTLADAIRGADVFLGLSKAGLCTAEMLKTMAKKPLIFALANPDPEISYSDAKAARPDAIVATGRSDFPNQVNNVLGFPYIFRGALDVRAKDIDESMKIAAARALAELAHEAVPDSVAEAYGGSGFRFGPDYIIPKPFDTRVLWWCAPAVAEAAMKSGAARLKLDIGEYRERLQRRTGGTQYTIMSRIVQRAKNAPKRIVFPDGDNIKVLRACQIVLDEGIAHPILLGSEKKIRQRAADLDLDLEGAELLNPSDSLKHSAYAHEYLDLRCRKGVTAASAARLMNRRIHFGMMMVRRGDADGLVAGLTAPYPDTIRPALQILGIRPDVRRATGMYMMLLKNDVKFFADATVNIDPDAETLADTAIQVADAARTFEVVPRIAMISFSQLRLGAPPRIAEGRGGRRDRAQATARSRDRRRGAGRHRGRTGEAARAVPVHAPDRRGQRAGVPVAGGGQRRLQGAGGAGRRDGDRADPAGRQQAGDRAAARRERRHDRQHDRLHRRPRHRPVA